MKYYAVKKGRKTGIYTTWDDCRAQVEGYYGAVYKKFNTEKEAENYLYDRKDIEVNAFDEINGISIYIKGDYNAISSTYSCGFIVVDDTSVEASCLSDKNTLYTEMRSIAGEIFGAMKAMEYCLERNIIVLNLYYNCDGIEKWCTGEMKAKKTAAQEYKKYYDEVKDKLKVVFHKVNANFVNEYTEMATHFAKMCMPN